MAMNVGLDLEASSMPLTPDPAVRGRRRPTTVGRAAFESVLQDEGDDYNRALRAYVSELIASGMDPETANRVAVSRMVQNRMENIPEGAVADERTAAVGSGVELGINDPGAVDLGGPDRPGPYDLAGRPGYDRTFTPQELASQRGDQEAAMQAQREQWAEERNANIGAKYGPAAREIAEAGDAEGVTDYAATQTRAEKFRNDQRRRYEMDAREGSKAARDELVQQDARGAEARREFRQRAATTASGNMPSEKQRWENYRAQMMLAGSNPRKNMVNAWSMMNDPNVSEEQRRSLQYMLPGGQLAATVDANNAALAGRMAQSAMTAFLTNNPMATPEQRAMFEQRAREANPAAAGAQDIAAGKPESPEAQAELDRLAESMDTSWGGYSYENEQQLAATLQRPPYNMSQAEAEATAYRYAEKRRWISGGGPASARGVAPPAPGTPAPPAPTRPSPWTTGGV